MAPRWTFEHVVSVAPTPRSMTAAESLATTNSWTGLGTDGRSLWGSCRGSSREPYNTMVDTGMPGTENAEPGWRCSCPSRQHPCKHALALMLLWVRDTVPTAVPPEPVSTWLSERDSRAAAAATKAGRSSTSSRPETDPVDGSATDDHTDDPAPSGELSDRTEARNERVARMREGFRELERWLQDRMRAGLSDPAIASYETWDRLAARLVDAQVGALANRVRRVAGQVGASADWHDRVLAELGMLHLLAEAGLRVPELPTELGDGVALASGWQVRQSAVLDTAPVADTWLVAGRSDQREDRIEVRRIWLRSLTNQRWAMLLSFAAFQQSLDDSLVVGSVIDADLYLYPGSGLRALIGRREIQHQHWPEPIGGTIADACDQIGHGVISEPWTERLPAIVQATPTIADGRWLLTDHTGSLAIEPGRVSSQALAVLAAAGDVAHPITIEWTPYGVRPVAVHLDDRTLDIGRRADSSFVEQVGSRP